MRTLLLALALFASGCTYYGVGPAPASFDRSWDAAVGAMYDQGVQVTTQDRAAGVVAGRRGGSEVSVRLQMQSDGSIQVRFNTPGSSSQDQQLVQSVSRSYDVRMGR
jgi:hypothetical protein